MRFVIRSSRWEDKKDLQRLTSFFPLSNLSKEEKEIESKLNLSERSFKKTLPIEERCFLFVLEDLKTNRVIGCSQILGSSFSENHFYFKKEKDLLKIVQRKEALVQLGGLILDPSYRKSRERLGQQLSLLRFLYMALQEKEAWTPFLEVSFTAPLKEGNQGSLFWESLGEKILNKSYKEMIEMYQKRKQISFPMPWEVKVSSLSSEVQSILENVHPETASAYRGLLKLGFKKTGYHHFLDGGFSLEGEWKQTPWLKNSKRLLWKEGEGQDSFLFAQEAGGNFQGGRIQGEVRGEEFLSSSSPPFKKDSLLLTPFPLK